MNDNITPRWPSLRWRTSLANFLFLAAPWFFSWTRQYRNWKRARSEGLDPDDLSGVQTLHYVEGGQLTTGPIAVHLHLFYLDMSREFLSVLSRMPVPFDLFITVGSIADPDRIEAYFRRLTMARRVVVQSHPNRGRDLGPMMSVLRQSGDYELLIHLHTKRSSHIGGDHWRSHSLHHLFRDSHHVAAILQLFEREADLGLVFPVYPKRLRGALHWGANKKRAEDLLEDMLGESVKQFNLEPIRRFPAGSFFIARVLALQTLVAAGPSQAEFEAEMGQLDGTLAHAIERALPYIVEAAGYRSLQIKAPFDFRG